LFVTWRLAGSIVGPTGAAEAPAGGRMRRVEAELWHHLYKNIEVTP